MKVRKQLLTASALTSALFFASAAQAVPPHMPNLVDDGNLWKITDYRDAGPGHRQITSQGICFFYTGDVGTHMEYKWVSNTYPDWNGIARQEGDQVFMYGDFQWPYQQKRDGGHDSMDWEITTNNRDNVGHGHWKEWIEDGVFGQTVIFANMTIVRAGKCQFETPEEAFKYGLELPIPVGPNGEPVSPQGSSSITTLK